MFTSSFLRDAGRFAGECKNDGGYCLFSRCTSPALISPIFIWKSVHEVSGLGLRLFVQQKTSVYRTESRRYAPAVRYHPQLLCKRFFLCLPWFYVIGHVIQSAAFFSNVSQTNEKSLIFITFLFFIVFFFYMLHYVSLAIFYQFMRKK